MNITADTIKTTNPDDDMRAAALEVLNALGELRRGGGIDAVADAADKLAAAITAYLDGKEKQ